MDSNTTTNDGRLLVPICGDPQFPDACTRLGGLGRSRIYELVNEKQLVRVKIGQRAFITAASIAAYVERLTAAAGGAD